MDAGRFREDYLRRWVAEDGSKALEIRRDAEGATLVRAVRALMDAKYGWSDGRVVELARD